MQVWSSACWCYSESYGRRMGVFGKIGGCDSAVVSSLENRGGAAGVRTSVTGLLGGQHVRPSGPVGVG